jgi:hypothetical protein
MNVEVLADALASYVWEEHGGLIFYREPGGAPLGRAAPRWLDGDEAVRRVAVSAASYSLRRWNPTRVMRHQLWSAAGGRKSRRGPSKATAENARLLAHLMETEPHLTVPQLASELDVSERTVYTVKRRFLR